MADEQSSTFDIGRLRRAGIVRQIHFFDCLESTNSTALELARSRSLECPALVLAPRQTAGRGRGKNIWWSADGALLFSLVLEPPAAFDRSHWPKISLAAAVALCRHLRHTTPEVIYGIRWPNDVFVSEQKIGGILVEVPTTAGDASKVVVGIGLNVNNAIRTAPPELQLRAASLIDLTASSFNLTDLLIDLLNYLMADFERLFHEPASLIQDWQRFCLLRGRRVSIEQGTRIKQGICRGIDDDGALVIDTPAGLERFFGGVLTSVD